MQRCQSFVWWRSGGDTCFRVSHRESIVPPSSVEEEESQMLEAMALSLSLTPPSPSSVPSGSTLFRPPPLFTPLLLSHDPIHLLKRPSERLCLRRERITLVEPRRRGRTPLRLLYPARRPLRPNNRPGIRMRIYRFGALESRRRFCLAIRLLDRGVFRIPHPLFPPMLPGCLGHRESLPSRN